MDWYQGLGTSLWTGSTSFDNFLREHEKNVVVMPCDAEADKNEPKF